MGVISPIGIGVEAYVASMREGRSGVGPLTRLAEYELPVPFGGEVKDFDAKQYVTPRKSIKVMCHEIQMAFSAGVLAMQQAGVEKGTVPPDRIGVVLGSEMHYVQVDELKDAIRGCVVNGEFCFDLWGEKMSQMYPLWMLKYLPNMAACHIGIALDARGPTNSHVLGDVSSLHALMEAAAVIQRGHADVMITGGIGSRIDITPIMYRGDANLSHRLDDPAAACRPFDRDRDGIVNGEGAGMFVVESRQHAEARGAKILATVEGQSCSVHSLSDPTPNTGRAIRMTISQALERSGITADDIGHVNANGLSTVSNDMIEATAIHELLGDVPVTAPKSYFGDLGAGTAAVEMVASVQTLNDGLIPATLNYETPDPKCPINVVHGQPLTTTKSHALVLSQSTMGQAAAVVLGKA